MLREGEAIRYGAWWWKRKSDGRVAVGFGSEFSTSMSSEQWDEVVRHVGGEHDRAN